MKRENNSSRRIEDYHQAMAALDRAADRVIVARSQCSLMSDTKWQRVFSILKGLGAFQHPVRWKFVDIENVLESRIDFVADRALELQFGVCAFRHIEWMEMVTPKADVIQRELAKRGLFEIERTADGLRLYGYR